MTTTRITEGGTTRLLESVLSTPRLTEALALDSVTTFRPFRFGIGPASGSRPVIELADFASIQLTGNKASGWQATWNMSGTALAAGSISELASDLFAYLGSAGFQRFRITKAEQEWAPNGDTNVAVGATDFLGVMGRRFTTTELTYTGVGQGTIAWNLIAHAQGQTGGNYGITAGTLDTATTRDRTYPVGTNIGEALRQLSEVIGGPWYRLGADKVFHALAPSARPVQAQPLQLGGTARRLKRLSGADRFANAVQGTGDDTLTARVFATEAGLSTDPRGRWERQASWSSVIDQATLVEHTDAELDASLSPLTTWSAEIEPKRWLTDFPIRPGDLVSLVKPLSILATAGSSTTEVDVEVAEMQLTVSASGELSSIAATFVEL